MPSGLIIRYAQVSGKPVPEVEKHWRTIKQEFSATGRKREYEGCIRKLRENLGLKKDQGRLAYLHGVAPALILAETPDYACIKVEDIDLVEDPGLCYALFSSNGVAAVPFSLLSHKEGGPMLIEVVDTSNLGAGTSVHVQTSPTHMQTATPARTTKPGAPPGTTSFQSSLQGLVTYRGRRAVVITRDNVKAHIRYLDQQGGEEDVTTSELQPDKTPMESIRKIWTSIDDTISETAKRRVFEAILMLEYSIAYLPDGLREDIEGLPKAIDGINLKNVNDEPKTPQRSDKRQKNFIFDTSDWELIFNVKGDDEKQEDEAAKENPIPDPPTEEEGEREGEPAEKGIPPASDKEVHGMLRHMKSARENFLQGARGGWESDRPRISLNEMREKAEADPFVAESIMEKNLKRAHQWEEHFS